MGFFNSLRWAHIVFCQTGNSCPSVLGIFMYYFFYNILSPFIFFFFLALFLETSMICLLEQSSNALFLFFFLFSYSAFLFYSLRDALNFSFLVL